MLQLCKMATGKVMKIMGMADQKGALPASRTVKVYLDLGAATQSGRKAAEEEGYLFIGMYLREWVFTAAKDAWVQNIVIDYTALPQRRLSRKLWQRPGTLLGI